MPEQGWTVRLMQFRIDDEVEDPSVREVRHIHWDVLDIEINKMLQDVHDDTTYVMVLRDERGD
jgi:hypothetical protein